jgi:uncharacterized phage-associated protein
MSEIPSAAIANAFVDLAGGAIPQMKMHKLTYMAHGWNLAIANEPLTADAPEAWDNGPVYRLIWDRIRDFGTKGGKILKPDGEPYEANLSAQQRQVLAHVWNKYRTFNQFDLSEMTHQPGTPWTETYFGRGRNAVIDNGLVREHYRQLALAGRG